MINALSQRAFELIKGCSFCLLVTIVLASAAWGQTQISTGSIQGVVSDQTGAVVPGASSMKGMSREKFSQAGRRILNSSRQLATQYSRSHSTLHYHVSY